MNTSATPYSNSLGEKTPKKKKKKKKNCLTSLSFCNGTKIYHTVSKFRYLKPSTNSLPSLVALPYVITNSSRTVSSSYWHKIILSLRFSVFVSDCLCLPVCLSLSICLSSLSRLRLCLSVCLSLKLTSFFCSGLLLFPCCSVQNARCCKRCS